jgi:hydrogenase maturation protease
MHFLCYPFFKNKKRIDLKVLVVGLGQEWRSEDAFGFLMIEILRGNPIFQDYQCSLMTSQGNLTEVIESMQNYNFILWIDAINCGVASNHELVFSVFEELMDQTWIEKKLGTHFFSLKEIYLLAKTLNIMNCQMWFLGCNCKNFSLGAQDQTCFSPAVFEQAAGYVTQWVRTLPWSRASIG